jgi:hypothetical protein
MDRRHLLTCFVVVLLGVTAGCSSAPTDSGEKKAEKKAAATPEPVSGQSAAFAMFQVARQWAGDAEILKLENLNLDEVPSQPGKYGGWQASFVSPSKKQSRPYTYSVVDSGPTLHKGVFAQGEIPYMPNPQIRSMPIQALKVDSPAALATAMKEKDAQDYAKQHPDLPVQFELEWSGQTPTPAWRVIWGPSVSRSDFSMFVDAQTNHFIKKSR